MYYLCEKYYTSIMVQYWIVDCVGWVPRLTLLDLWKIGLMNGLSEWNSFTCRGLQFSHSDVSNCLQPHGLQHVRLPCPSSTPGAGSNSGPLSLWCHPTISSSVVPFSSCLQSFPASGSFQMSQFFVRIRWPKYWSFSFSISPSNEYLGLISFKMDWFDILAVQGALKSLLQHCSSKASILRCSAFFMVQLISIHDYWKNHSFD